MRQWIVTCLLCVSVAALGAPEGKPGGLLDFFTGEAPKPAGDATQPEDPETGPPRNTITGPAGDGRQGLDTPIPVINIRDMELTQAVRMLAEVSGINITVGQDVEGKVSCNLNNVTARIALEAFLRSNGYTYVDRDGVLIVVTEDKAKEFDKGAVATKIVRRTFRLPYTGKEKEFITGTPTPVPPAETTPVEDIIRQMLSARGRMAFYERHHLVVVEDDEEVIGMIEEFVKALWDTPLQVFIDSRLLEVTYEDGEDYGMQWNVQRRFTTEGREDDRTGDIDMLGTLATTTAPTLGLDRNFTYGVVNSNIEIVLEAISTRSRVDLRSNPTVLVMNHRTASIVVGQEVPYVSSEESTGGNPIRTVEFKEVAVRLDVTPHVNDEMVFLDVNPSVKSVIGFTEDPRQPIISTREAVTNVAIQSGSTLIIGGLAQRNTTRSRSWTPWVADIPVIGWIFRQNSLADTKNDLIFLLTPQVVTPEIVEAKIEAKKHLTEPLPRHGAEIEEELMKALREKQKQQNKQAQ